MILDDLEFTFVPTGLGLCCMCFSKYLSLRFAFFFVLFSQSILTMAVSPSNSILYTGDSLGFVKQWDIRDYFAGGECNRDRPRLVNSWRAHVQVFLFGFR